MAELTLLGDVLKQVLADFQILEEWADQISSPPDSCNSGYAEGQITDTSEAQPSEPRMEEHSMDAEAKEHLPHERRAGETLYQHYRDYAAMVLLDRQIDSKEEEFILQVLVRYNLLFDRMKLLVQNARIAQKQPNTIQRDLAMRNALDRMEAFLRHVEQEDRKGAREGGSLLPALASALEMTAQMGEEI